MTEKQVVPLQEAAKEVELTSRRIALMHLAYARTLMDEMGDEEGKRLILKSIKKFAQLVGTKVKQDVEEQGLETTPENYGAGTARTLPKFGMNEGGEALEEDGIKRTRAYGCVMAKVWREYGEEDIGSLYCYVDPAKFMYYNPNYKLIHKKAMPVHGSNCCEFEVQPTTEKEREAFFTEDQDWTHLDPELGSQK